MQNEFFTTDSDLRAGVTAKVLVQATTLMMTLSFFDVDGPAPVDPVAGEKNADSYIKQLGHNHYKVHHKLENGDVINVELYDVENAYFADGNGGIELRPLTTGRPITTADYEGSPFQK